MEIINNVLSSLAFQRLETYFLTERCQWSYKYNATFSDAKDPDPGFHRSISYQDEINDSFLFENCIHILGNSCDKTNFKIDKILQSRSFMTMNFGESSGPQPHVDFFYPHHVCLYYVTSCPEDDEGAKTVFYDKKGNVIAKNTPTANQAVIFDGSIIHASGNPKTGRRIIININFLPYFTGDFV